MRYIIGQEDSEVIYVSGGHFVSNGAWTHPQMVLADYELVVVQRGCFQIIIKGVKREFKAGDSFILFPGEEHHGIEEAWDVSFYWLHFKFQGHEEIVEGDRNLRVFFQKTRNENVLRIILNEFLRQGDNTRLTVMINQLLHYQSVFKRNEEAVRPCNLMMEMVLYEQMQVAGIESKAKAFLRQQEEETDMDKIYEYIRATCYKNPQVFEIAQHFGYNPQYFSRMFRKITGVTPKQYIVERQIEKAKYMLTNTSLKIKEIAVQVGMNDGRVFFKNFKKCEGISPSAYRKAFKKTHYNSH